MTQSRTPTASQKHALAPDASTLDERSVRAWTEQMAVRRLGDGRYVVEGESGATYVVDLERGSCTCPDRQIRGERCKHLRRVAIEITLGRILPPGPAPVPCRGCGADLSPEERATRHELCSSCYLEPGTYVTDRETGDRLRVVETSDRRADQVTIPELGTTVAEHPTNHGYDPGDPVVTATYPGAGGRSRRIYSFPLSRLRRDRSTDEEQQTLSTHAGTV